MDTVAAVPRRGDPGAEGQDAPTRMPAGPVVDPRPSEAEAHEEATEPRPAEADLAEERAEAMEEAEEEEEEAGAAGGETNPRE